MIELKAVMDIKRYLGVWIDHSPMLTEVLTNNDYVVKGGFFSHYVSYSPEGFIIIDFEEIGEGKYNA
jgi:hypothetical protein